MSTVSEIRKLLPSLSGPELIEISVEIASLAKRLDAMQKLDQLRQESLAHQLADMQQYSALDRRIRALEADRNRSV